MTALVALSLLLTAALWTWRTEGIPSIDEAHYLLAGRRWHDAGSFEIRSGYAQFPDPLLLPLFPTPSEYRPRGGGGSTFIPPLYTFPVAAAWAIAGNSGLFAINAIAFSLLIPLGGWLALRMTGRTESALFAAAGIAFGGCLPEYAISGMNHLLTLLLMLLAIAAHPWARLPNGEDQEGDLAELGRCLLSGFLVGMAIGVRLQQLVTLAVLATLALASRRGGLARMGLFLLGAALPLGGVAAINQSRFGVPNPFTYGLEGTRRVVPMAELLPETAAGRVVALGLVAALAIGGWMLLGRWWWTQALDRRDHWWRKLVLGGGLLCIASLTIAPGIAGRAARRIWGVFPWAGDSAEWFGVFPLNVYVGVSNSLLQSSPLVLAAVLAPMAALVGRGTRGPSRPMVLLMCLIGGHAVFASLLGIDGGHPGNQRYLLEVSVLAAMLLPFSLPAWGTGDGQRWASCAGLAALISVIMLLILPDGIFLGKMMGDSPVNLLTGMGWAITADRVLPLMLAYGFAGVLVWYVVLGPRAPAYAKGLVMGLATVVLVMPIFLHYRFDMLAASFLRERALSAYEQLREAVPEGSLVVVPPAVRAPSVVLMAERDVWVATAARTEWKGVAELLKRIDDVKARTHLFIVAIGMPEDVAREVGADFSAQKLPSGIPLLLLQRRVGSQSAAQGPTGTTAVAP